MSLAWPFKAGFKSLKRSCVAERRNEPGEPEFFSRRYATTIVVVTVTRPLKAGLNSDRRYAAKLSRTEHQGHT